MVKRTALKGGWMPLLSLTFLYSGKFYFIMKKSGNFEKCYLWQPCKLKRTGERGDIQIKQLFNKGIGRTSNKGKCHILLLI